MIGPQATVDPDIGLHAAARAFGPGVIEDSIAGDFGLSGGARHRHVGVLIAEPRRLRRLGRVLFLALVIELFGEIAPADQRRTGQRAGGDARHQKSQPGTEQTPPRSLFRGLPTEWYARAVQGDRDIQAELAQREAAERAAQDRERAAQEQARIVEAQKARAEAERRANAWQDADRRRAEHEQDVAYRSMLAHAREEVSHGHYEFAESSFEAALRMRPDALVARELAECRIKSAEARSRREAEARRAALDREAEAARAAITAEQQRQADLARQQSERGGAEARRLFADAAAATAQGQHDRAVSLLQAAQRLDPNPNTVNALNLALARLAADQAARRGAEEKAALEAALRQETERRAQAEAQFKAQHQRYYDLMSTAREAERAGRLDQARAIYDKAIAELPTVEARTARQRLEDHLAQQQASGQADREARIRAEAANVQHQREYDSALARGRQLAQAGKWDAAIRSFRQAIDLDPRAVDPRAELARAEAAYSRLR